MVSIVKYDNLLLANEQIDLMTASRNVKRIHFNKNIDIISILLQIDMFNAIDTYYIYDCDFLSSSDVFNANIELLKTIDKLKNEFDIYLFCSNKLLTNKEFKNIIESFKLITINSIDKKNKQMYVNKLLENRNISLSKNVYMHLLNCLTNDYGVMKNEINKIYNLISTKHDEQEIFNLISNYNEENVFYLVENILTNKFNAVWKTYNDLVYRKVDEIAIINALCSQLFNLYYISILNKKKKSIGEIASCVEVPTFVVISFKNKFANLDPALIHSMLLDLYELEIKIKNSLVVKNIALKNLIIKWLANN